MKEHWRIYYNYHLCIKRLHNYCIVIWGECRRQCDWVGEEKVVDRKRVPMRWQRLLLWFCCDFAVGCARGVMRLCGCVCVRVCLYVCGASVREWTWNHEKRRMGNANPKPKIVFVMWTNVVCQDVIMAVMKWHRADSDSVKHITRIIIIIYVLKWVHVRSFRTQLAHVDCLLCFCEWHCVDEIHSFHSFSSNIFAHIYFVSQ